MLEGGLSFVHDLRSAGFVQSFEVEVKMLIAKCKMLVSKRVDWHKDKVAREFDVASERLKELSTLAANFVIVNQELPLMVYNSKLANEGMKGA